VPGDTTPVATPTATTAPAVVEPGDPAAPGQQTVLPVLDTGEVCAVGPTQGTGEVFSRGSAGVDIDQTGRWLVDVDLRDETTWNLLASQCYSGSSSCPSRQLAIVLDDVIQSAPVVNAPSFSGTVQITGQFSEGEARDLARVLNRGAFPVNVEAQSVQTVSPTLGEDSLRAAVFAGIVGIVVILLFLVAYYRRLAIVIVGGLIVWGMVVFSAAALVSATTNYALTLAGVTGIIVAIGVTVDSYIVFFERMKDEVRGGRSLRNAAPRSFKATWKTIVAADVVSILGATVLFWLSVGSVKGFALYLGITTVCDLIVCYFYTRPAVFLLTRRPGFDHATAIGVAAPVVTPTPSGATA
jgi:preprotein translocase subunit SecD